MNLLRNLIHNKLEMSETKRKEKQTNKSLLNIWLLELSEVGIRTPQTSPRRCLHPFSFNGWYSSLGLRREASV